MNYWHLLLGAILTTACFMLSTIGKYKSATSNIFTSVGKAISTGDVFAILFVVFALLTIAYWAWRYWLGLNK